MDRIDTYPFSFALIINLFLFLLLQVIKVISLPSTIWERQDVSEVKV